MRRSDRLGAVLGQKLARSATGRLLTLSGLLLSTVLLAVVQLAEPAQSSAIWG